MNYIKFTCSITSENPQLICDILMQTMADAGFESFEEQTSSLLAYIPEKSFTADIENSLPGKILDLGSISYTKELIPDKNWNQEWEKNFPPVVIAGKCYIRAPFHPAQNYPYEILMEPKMAFGTGHHETTALMIEQMLSLDFAGKEVLDMGCGTGVLSIMASKLKSKHILAIDIDEWAYHSTLENCLKNDVTNVTTLQGDIDLVQGKTFGIILANINRNILLNQILSYAESLPSEGHLLMSGIYKSDFEVISEAALKNRFIFIKMQEKNNWISVLFKKK